MPTPSNLPMTSAEFRVLRERLGLTTNWLAQHLDVLNRSVQRWDRGDRAQTVPAEPARAMRELEQQARDRVDELVQQLHTQADSLSGQRLPTVTTYVTDEQYQVLNGGPWTASWHRAVVGRAMEAYGRPVVVHYATNEDEPVDN